MTELEPSRFAAGAAYIDGRYMPVGEAAIPLTDWGYRRSDVTYDVVGVWDGAFFRLDDHIRRFRASMDALHMKPAESDDEIKAVLHRLVRLSGLRAAYVAMDCLRGVPAPGKPRHPAYARNYIAAFAVPWVSVAGPEMCERGLHLMIAETLRIPPESVEPRIKNFHWGDLTRGQFEAMEKGADFAILLDAQGNVTEGAGFNVFSITEWRRGDTGPGSARRHHEAVDDRTLRRAGHPVRGAAGLSGGAARGGRNLHLHHRRRRDAGLPHRRPDHGQRPAGACLGAVARCLLGEARRGLARDAG